MFERFTERTRKVIVFAWGDARSLEAAARMLGERLLESFPAMPEPGVGVSGAPEPSDPTFSVSTTFRR